MISFDFEKIAPVCAGFGVTLTDEITERLTVYGNLLVEWNEKMNLTAITEPNDILYKHFLDCLLFFKHIDVPQNARVIDVGTGAGFPGMVLLIARPDLKVTLLDGLNKRLVFLQTVLDELGLCADTVHLRAEEAGKNPLFREQFDIACARAVAALPTLSEYCMPLVKKGGVFVAMKGQNGETEAKNAKAALALLGGGKTKISSETLTGEEERTFIITEKRMPTPPKYPRAGGQISKKPL